MNNIEKINRSALDAIQTEAEALFSLYHNLPLDFSKVVVDILKLQGRVIISGIGKSGHIGRKIAATLSSTGTPAYFIHASEASHGDLGMIDVSDFCILISNSGETSELKDIIAHTRRFNIPLAAISSNIESTLMASADYKLNIPKYAEACPIGMAPTTSTTLTLVLGDALAISLMSAREFKKSDFSVNHPGGKLGSHLTTVEKMMRHISEMAILEKTATMLEIVLKMTETGYGIAVLTNGFGKLEGIITDGDLRRNVKNILNIQSEKILTKNPVTIEPNALVETAIAKMNKHKVYTLIVTEKNEPIGLLRMHDIIRAGFV